MIKWIVGAIALFATLTYFAFFRYTAEDMLFTAAENGDLALARQALRDGASPRHKSEYDGQTTALDVARSNGYTEIVRLMEQKSFR